MTPLNRYKNDLAAGDLVYEPAQEKAVKCLQRTYDALIKPPTFANRLFSKLIPAKKKTIKGLYLWGSVGIGKTYLMDLFYNNLPIKKKSRLHFHQFMKQIQDELRNLQGQPDPLIIIAHKLAKEVRVICFDEFLVWDIADAMLLGRLFNALFAQGITLVATSNTHPDNLYENGLQRELFLPTIALLKQYTEIFYVDIDTDYRFRHEKIAHTYFSPLDKNAEKKMHERFDHFSKGKPSQSNQTLIIENRPIKTLKISDKTVWFDFNIICNIPRSQVDYLKISRQYQTVLISNIPKITVKEDNLARYLVNLVDVFYDAGIRLIVSAAVPIEDLYQEGPLLFEFHRTVSRLQEMQSLEYIDKQK